MTSFLRATVITTVGILIAACNGQIDSQATTACPLGQRSLNGQCLDTCTSSAACRVGSRCVALDGEGGACVPEVQATCAYLASDTKCVGIDSYYFYGFRGGSEYVPLPSEPPSASRDGLTTEKDGDFASSFPYGYGGTGTEGCQGDAKYVKVAATTDPACAERHPVVRCRRIGNSCRLVSGTTAERFSP